MKYGDIPVDYNERLSWMVDKYNLTPSKMDEILQVRGNVLNNLYFYECTVVQLLEEPEGTHRPRFRIINKGNYNREAINNSQFVHVYTPQAKDDFLYMKKMTDDELIQLDGLINTPCDIEYTAFYKTPSYCNTTEIFLREIGLIRPNIFKPDWDNVGKKYCDMYNHNIWLDDAQVIDGVVHKYYSILPRIEIKLKYLNAVYTKKQHDAILKRKDYDGTPLQYLDKTGRITNGTNIN